MPGWPLNTRTDELLKNEFDKYRERQQPHPIFIQHNLNFVPFQHEDMEIWRNSLSGGIGYKIDNTNLFLYGGVDDIWKDLDTNELVVCDYKSKSKKEKINEKKVWYTGATRARNTIHLLSTDYKYNYPLGDDYLVYVREKKN